MQNCETYTVFTWKYCVRAAWQQLHAWLAGFLHMEKREWKEAEDTFTELRKEPSAKADLYAVLALGAIPLNSLSSSRRKVGGNLRRSPCSTV